MSNSEDFEAIKAAATQAGFEETGGGDDFDFYLRPDTGLELSLYLFTDGRWEHHNLNTQDGDTTEEARKTGRGAESLTEYLREIDVIE